MKTFLASLAMSLTLGSSIMAAPILICDGTYIASQQMLSGRGYVVQGARGLGSVKIKVQECGAKISITAQGMTIPLTRTSDTIAHYTGTFQTPKPLLTFNLTAFTPRTIGGTMKASDGSLTINRTMALMLKSGKPANLEGCVNDTAMPTLYPNVENAIIETFAALKKSANANNPADHIQSITKTTTRTDATASYDVRLYLDANGDILSKQSLQDLQTLVCGAGNDANTPKYTLEFLIDKANTSTKTSVQVVEISTGKIIETQTASGNAMTASITKAWQKLEFKTGALTTS